MYNTHKTCERGAVYTYLDLALGLSDVNALGGVVGGFALMLNAISSTVVIIDLMTNKG